MTKNIKSVLQGLNSSGHNLHLQVVNKLLFDDNVLDFDDVMISPYYVDRTTDKKREIDIIAKKDWPITQNKNLTFRFFIECKYLKQDVIFLENYCSKDKFIQIWDKQFHKEVSYEAAIVKSVSRYRDYYSNQKIAVLCEPFDNLFKGVESCIKAREYSTLVEERKNFIDYFLVVVDKKMYKINRLKSEGDEYKEIDYLPMLINYVSETRGCRAGNDPWFVEFVTKDKLDWLFDQIFKKDVPAVYAHYQS